VFVVQVLLQHGADVNAKMAGNVTPLMLSLDMAFGKPEIALALIQGGADVNAADEHGDTALIIATTESSLEVFETLLDKGANPNAKGLHGDTALHHAAMNALLDRAKLLLAHGADANIQNSARMNPCDVASTTNPDKAVQAKFQETKELLLDAARQKRKLPPSPD
jgi:ankyrin repeat protein